MLQCTQEANTQRNKNPDCDLDSLSQESQPTRSQSTRTNNHQTLISQELGKLPTESPRFTNNQSRTQNQPPAEPEIKEPPNLNQTLIFLKIRRFEKISLNRSIRLKNH